MSSPRLLAIMGSGETSPTMVKTHRRLLEQVGGPAVLLDTPFGFQENASELGERAVQYFHDSVGTPIEVASWRSTDDDRVAYETMLTAVRGASYVFAGPGSPSYALRQWSGTPVPDLLAAKLRDGGCVTFASAAALTLGAVTVPVYEIYKVGESPRWLEGLDLLGPLGLPVAVIPHYDNAEGGTHDTRFCYLGERRLALLEQSLPDGAFVLGVDEHTALVLDLDAGTAAVEGVGAVTVRRHGESHRLASGATVPLSELGSTVWGRSTTRTVVERAQTAGAAPARSPLLDTAARLEDEFDTALGAGDLRAAVAAVLELEEQLVAWSADTLQSDEPDRARAVLRSMIVRLGRRTDVAPLVDTLLELRDGARADGRYDVADRIRDRLVELGVEVHDAPEGSTWRLLS